MNSMIGIIGGGAMGGAMYSKLTERFGHEHLCICDKHEEKLQALHAKNFSTNAADIAEKSDIVIIAVKPQTFSELCDELNGVLKGKLVISVMAGIPLEVIAKKTGARRLVRSLPNLPAQIGKGYTIWTSQSLHEEEQKKVSEIFSCMGTELKTNSEAMIENIGALSGCGPAYFFFLCELIAQKGMDMGLSKEEAEDMAKTTFTGTALLFEQSEKDAKSWREAVSSKGGVTERAVSHMRAEGLDQIFSGAIDKAVLRTRELCPKS